MNDKDWNARHARVLGVCWNGRMDEVDERGKPIVGTTLLILFSAEPDPVTFRLPPVGRHQYWRPVVDTGRHDQLTRRYDGLTGYELAGRSCALFELRHARLRWLRRLLGRTNGGLPWSNPDRTEPAS